MYNVNEASILLTWSPSWSKNKVCDGAMKRCLYAEPSSKFRVLISDSLHSPIACKPRGGGIGGVDIVWRHGQERLAAEKRIRDTFKDNNSL